jgi:hypothetical protein
MTLPGRFNSIKKLYLPNNQHVIVKFHLTWLGHLSVGYRLRSLPEVSLQATAGASLIKDSKYSGSNTGKLSS